jgi:hypothetical protein
MGVAFGRGPSLSNLLNRKFELAVFAIYATVVVIFNYRHSMWRDEAQLWLLARSSDSLVDLYRNTKDELRPLGWFLICWVVSRFTQNFESIKVVNCGLSLFAAYLMLFRSSAPRTLSIMFIFSFLPLLGYAVISEDYMLGLVLTILVVLAIKNQSYIWSIVLLGLLANVHFLYFLIAGPTFLAVACYWMIFRLSDSELNSAKKLGGIVAIGTTFFLHIFSLVTIWPDRENRWRPQPILQFSENIERATNSLLYSVFPFGDAANLRIANSNLWLFIGMVTWAGVCWMIYLVLRTNWFVGIVGSGVLLLLISNMVFGYGYYWWHFGVIFIGLFAIGLSALIGNVDQSYFRNLKLVLTLFLLPQLFSTATMPGRQFVSSRPYSTARAAAEIVEAECKQECTVLVSHEMYGVGISAYLGGQPVFYIDKQRFGTFAQWGDLEYYEVNWNSMVFALQRFQNSILVAPSIEGIPDSVEMIAEFQNAIWSDENFSVYRLSRS